MHRHENIHMDREVVFEEKIAVFREHEMHTHDALEISVLLENEAIYRLASRDYLGKPGDVFIFRPFEPHWTLMKNPDRPVGWTMILFSPSFVRAIPGGYKLLAPFYAMDLFQPLIAGSSSYAREIHQAARLGLQEENNRIPGWQAVQHAMLVQVLAAIYRCYLESRAQADPADSELEDGIIRVIEHLLRHYAESVDGSLLISLSGVGKTKFYQTFQAITGLSPNDFITYLRLQHAAHLLKFSQQPITELAFECGFNSISYFNRVFKQNKGVSPREYRGAAQR